MGFLRLPSAQNITVKLFDIALFDQVIVIGVVGVPYGVEMFVEEVSLFNTFYFSDSAKYISGGDICFVFGEHASSVGFTERGYILIDTFLDILLLMPNFFLLLNLTKLLLLFLFFLPLLVFLFLLLCPFFLFLFAFHFVHFCLFFLLCVLRTIDPLDVSLSLIVFVH